MRSWVFSQGFWPNGPGPYARDKKAIRDVPIFDAHMHYKQEAWELYPVRTVIELMDRSGVAMALVSSTPVSMPYTRPSQSVYRPSSMMPSIMTPNPTGRWRMFDVRACGTE